MADDRPDPVTREDIRGLREDTQGLTTTIEDFATKAELKNEAGKRHRSVLGGLLLAVALLAAGLYVKNGQDEILANRAESRRAVCDNDNHFIENHNRLVAASVSMLDLIAAAPANRTPEQQAAVDAFLMTSRAGFEATRVEPRDCSPAGIAAFYRAKGNR